MYTATNLMHFLNVLALHMSARILGYELIPLCVSIIYNAKNRVVGDASQF